MKKSQKFVWACMTGILLGLSFPPFRLGLLACVALVPLFFLLERIEKYSVLIRYGYLAFLVFNIVTLYWIGGYTHRNDMFLMLGGAAVILVHPFFFLVPTIAVFFLKKALGILAPITSAPFLWVAFEWVHSLGELGFPWLTLGNTQTYAIERIQFITWTGVYGVTFWIVAVNVLIFFLLQKVLSREWKAISAKSLTLTFVILIAALLPGLHGRITLHQAGDEKKGNNIRVGILQPNIDPWKKWEIGPEEQLQLYLGQTKTLVKDQPELIIWPETAISFRIFSGKYIGIFQHLKEKIDSLSVALLTGFADIVFYDGESAPRGSKVVAGTGIRYDDFNAVMLLEPKSEQVQKYAKMRLVPFGERVPYAEHLTFLVEAVKWNVGISGWGIGRDTTVFVLKRGDSEAKFSGMVCYESIYPELVAAFVRKGAQFLVVVTNDSWYGNTSGPYQHAQYAVLRAIENRRAIVRCANGGISCLIDPYGKMSEVRGMFTQASIVGEIKLGDESTFYSSHGDLFAKACAGVGVLFLLTAAVGKLIRKRQGESN